LRVLGVDPGLFRTGYAIIDQHRHGLQYVLYGEIGPDKGTILSHSLMTIYDRLFDLIRETGPDCMAVESVFFGKNARSLIKQAHVRGIVLLAGARSGIPVFEYSPLEIKKAVVGFGRAEKRQVQQMVKSILKLTDLPPSDAADAMAAAICHANALKVSSV
jgi:crossover junction endodeoxyribonuclease RuvC